MTKKNKIALLGGAVIAALLLGWLCLSSGSVAVTESEKGILKSAQILKPSEVTRLPVKAVMISPQEKGYRTPQQLDHDLFAQSLQGTDIDGQLRADENGNLIIELKSRDFFDYFLSTSGEVGVESAIDEILRYVQTYLPEPAAQQASELLEQYLRYKKFSIELQRTPIEGGMDTQGYLNLLQQTFAKQKATRRELFSPIVNDAFFGLEDAYAQYTLKNMSIQNDLNLSDDEKKEMFEANRATLPLDVQTTIAHQERATITNQKVTKILNSELDDTQVYSQLVEQGYEHGKAEEIIAHRQQRDSFEQRYSAYQAVKAELVRKKLTSQEMKQMLMELQSRYFISSQEQTQARLRDLSISQ